MPDFSGNGNYFSLYRYLANGFPDPAFGVDGTTTLGNGFFNGPVIVTSQGDKAVATSYSYNIVTGNYGFAVGRYNADGTFDNSFNGSGTQIIDFGEPTPVIPRALLTVGDTLYVGGDKYNAFSQKIDFAIARFNNDGTLDPSFDGDGKQVTGNGDFSLSTRTISPIHLAAPLPAQVQAQRAVWFLIKALPW